MRRVVGVVVFVLAAAGCASGQDPGFDQTPNGPTSSTTTPGLLQPCPDGGPDATTAVAGCLDEDGRVRRP